MDTTAKWLIGFLAALTLCLGAADVSFSQEAQASTPLRTRPIMRGTLWWVGAKGGIESLTREQLAREIEMQTAVGFDLLWLCNAPQLVERAKQEASNRSLSDPLEVILELADAEEMQVIVSLNRAGGHWLGRIDPQALIDDMVGFIREVKERYGHHRSFHGWYLSHEINPIAPGEEAASAFWRQVWRDVTAACHRVAPDSIVTISPFFLLDAAEKRGFRYLRPAEYEQWWTRTLRETGIDIVMVQDSGEHVAFLTLDDREPYLAAFARACANTGKSLWINVESAEIDVPGWDSYLDLERQGSKEPGAGIMPWRVTPMDWLGRKLQLAARYGTGIVNWGYYPFMDPHPAPGPYAAVAPQAYQAYRAYYEKVAGTSTCDSRTGKEGADASQ